MSATSLIIGVVLGGVLVALIVALWLRFRDVSAVAIVAGIAALAILALFYRVHQYQEQKAARADLTQAEPTAAFGGSIRPPQPWAGAPTPPGRGATGAAAPSPTESPSAGGAR